MLINVPWNFNILSDLRQLQVSYSLSVDLLKQCSVCLNTQTQQHLLSQWHEFGVGLIVCLINDREGECLGKLFYYLLFLELCVLMLVAQKLHTLPFNSFACSIPLPPAVLLIGLFLIFTRSSIGQRYPRRRSLWCYLLCLLFSISAAGLIVSVHHMV